MTAIVDADCTNPAKHSVDPNTQPGPTEHYIKSKMELQMFDWYRSLSTYPLRYEIDVCVVQSYRLL